MLNINGRVTIVPTGDPDIDVFVGKDLTITNYICTNDGGYRYTRYEVTDENGNSTTVIEQEIRNA